MVYVGHLHNVTSSPTLAGIASIQSLTGQVPDSSFLLHFTFWELVYYKVDQTDPDSHFPSQSKEKCGHWVGFAEDKGDQFAWKILTDDTQKILIWSSVHSATKTFTNMRLTLPMGRDKNLSHIQLFCVQCYLAS